MTSVTSTSRSEWTTRLAQALVRAGYETDAALKPLVNEAIATDQSLAYLLIERGLANVPGKLPPVVQHRNPRRNAQRKVVRQIGARQYRKAIKAARRVANVTLA